MLSPISDREKGLVLVSGPSKGGKSVLAEFLIRNNKHITYIATSPKDEDKQWEKRIEIHKQRRPNDWNLIESPVDLVSTINDIDDSQAILIDSLGSFVYNYINLDEDSWNNISTNFVETLKIKNSLIIIVIEETGWGIVSPTKIGNLFKDRLGTLSQQLQPISIASWLAIQGRAINLNNISSIIPCN